MGAGQTCWQTVHPLHISAMMIGGDRHPTPRPRDRAMIQAGAASLGQGHTIAAADDRHPSGIGPWNRRGFGTQRLKRPGEEPEQISSGYVAQWMPFRVQVPDSPKRRNTSSSKCW